MQQVQTKQPIVIDMNGFSSQLEIQTQELDSIKSSGIMILDAESCANVAARAIKAKQLIEKTEEIFKPAKDAMAIATKALKTSLSVITDPATKFQEEARKEVEQFLRDNPDAEVENARIQRSKWKLTVNDEDALLKAGVKVSSKKIDGKMTQIIEFDPKIRALFAYVPAKGNALASAMTTACDLPGCKAEQDDMLVLSEPK